MKWLSEKLTDLYRPWYHNGLPEELSFGEIEAWGFVRGAMERAARGAVKLNLKLGVFEVIGTEYARRAARAWWPRERLLMEDVSFAFQLRSTLSGSTKLLPKSHGVRNGPTLFQGC